MARRNGNEIQDRLITQMEKITRNMPDEGVKSLRDQLSEFHRTPEEKQKSKTPADWNKDLVDLIHQDRTVNIKLYAWVSAKYKKEMEEFRTSGTPYKDVLVFIRSKSIEFINL